MTMHQDSKLFYELSIIAVIVSKQPKLV